MKKAKGVPKVIDYSTTVDTGNGEKTVYDYDRAKAVLGMDNEKVAGAFGLRASSLSSSTARHRYKAAFVKIVAAALNVRLQNIYSGVGFLSPDGEELGLCMRDGGYEITYNGKVYELKGGNPPNEL